MLWPEGVRFCCTLTKCLLTKAILILLYSEDGEHNALQDHGLGPLKQTPAKHVLLIAEHVPASSNPTPTLRPGIIFIIIIVPVLNVKTQRWTDLVICRIHASITLYWWDWKFRFDLGHWLQKTERYLSILYCFY